MTRKTQQKILKALNCVFADLDRWLSGLGLSRSQVWPFLVAAFNENGLMAGFLQYKTTEVFPASAMVNADPNNIVERVEFFRSEGFVEWLLSQPEPKPEELEFLLKVLRQAKDALPALRAQLLHSAKTGPRFKRGGRPRKLLDEETRMRIREEIKRIRATGTTLKSAFARMAQKYGVSAATIKRIWDTKGLDNSPSAAKDE